jgi:hypothetical protein
MLIAYSPTSDFVVIENPGAGFPCVEYYLASPTLSLRVLVRIDRA